MRALIGRLNGSSPKKASQVQSNEKTLPNGIAEGEWPKGDTNKDARKSAPTISDAHSPLSSPLPSTLSPRLQINSCLRQDVASSSSEIMDLRTEVQALTKSLGEMHNLLLSSRSGHNKCKKELKEVCNRIDRMTQHQFSKYKDRLEDLQSLTEKRVEELKRFYETKIYQLKSENALLREIVQNSDVVKDGTSRNSIVGYIGDLSGENYDNQEDARSEIEAANVMTSGGIDSNETGSLTMYKSVNSKAMMKSSKDVHHGNKRSLQSPKKASKFKELQSNCWRNYGQEVYEKWRNEKSLSNDNKRSQTIDSTKIEADVNSQVVSMRKSIVLLFQLLDAAYMENDTLHSTVDFLHKELLDCAFIDSLETKDVIIDEADYQKEDIVESLEFDNDMVDRLLTTQEHILTALRIQNDPKKVGHTALEGSYDNSGSSDDESIESLKVSLLELHSILQKCRSKNHANEFKALQVNAQLEECKHREESIGEDYKNLQKYVKKYKRHITAVLRQRHEDFLDAKEKSMNMVHDIRRILLGTEISSDHNTDENISKESRSPSKISKYMQPVNISQIPDENDEDFSAPYTSAKLNKAGINFTKVSL